MLPLNRAAASSPAVILLILILLPIFLLDVSFMMYPGNLCWNSRSSRTITVW
jgi:hypothetical protein